MLRFVDRLPDRLASDAGIEAPQAGQVAFRSRKSGDNSSKTPQDGQRSERDMGSTSTMGWIAWQFSSSSLRSSRKKDHNRAEGGGPAHYLKDRTLDTFEYLRSSKPGHVRAELALPHAFPLCGLLAN